MLKDEITNIAMRIVKAREASNNMAFSENTGKLHGTWKVGEVEMMSKGFSEQNRYFNMFPYQRNYGLKFVPPPVGSETFQQLKAESEHFHLNNPNYLLNGKFSKTLNQNSMKKLTTFNESNFNEKTPEE